MKKLSMLFVLVLMCGFLSAANNGVEALEGGGDNRGAHAAAAEEHDNRERAFLTDEQMATAAAKLRAATETVREGVSSLTLLVGSYVVITVGGFFNGLYDSTRGAQLRDRYRRSYDALDEQPAENDKTQ